MKILKNFQNFSKLKRKKISDFKLRFCTKTNFQNKIKMLSIMLTLL